MSSSSEEHRRKGKKRKRENTSSDYKIVRQFKKFLESEVRGRRRRSRDSTSTRSSESTKENAEKRYYENEYYQNNRRSRSRYRRNYSDSDERNLRGTPRYSRERDSGERCLRGASRGENQGDGERSPRDSPRQEPEIQVIETALENEELLNLLGEDTKHEEVGPPIHSRLAEKWVQIMKQGLPKENREELLKKYPPAENCLMLKAPNLNPEIKTAITTKAIKKDTFQAAAQNQTGSGINAIGKALTLLLEGGGNVNDSKAKLVEILSDAGRILTDLHHTQSMTRRSFIVPGLNIIVKNIADETVVDTMLFGEEFSSKLKAAKDVEKASKDVAKILQNPNNIRNASTQKTSYRGSTKTNTGNSRYLNSRGPPKKGYSSHRSGGQKSRFMSLQTKNTHRK